MSSSSSTSRRGVLLKRSDNLHTWRERYFVLTDGCLLWHENEAASTRKPRGVLRLGAGCSVSRDTFKADGLWAFNVQLPDQRVMWLGSKNRDEAAAWVRALLQCLTTEGVRAEHERHEARERTTLVADAPPDVRALCADAEEEAVGQGWLLEAASSGGRVWSRADPPPLPSVAVLGRLLAGTVLTAASLMFTPEPSASSSSSVRLTACLYLALYVLRVPAGIADTVVSALLSIAALFAALSLPAPTLALALGPLAVILVDQHSRAYVEELLAAPARWTRRCTIAVALPPSKALALVLSPRFRPRFDVRVVDAVPEAADNTRLKIVHALGPAHRHRVVEHVQRRVQALSARSFAVMEASDMATGGVLITPVYSHSARAVASKLTFVRRLRRPPFFGIHAILQRAHAFKSVTSGLAFAALVPILSGGDLLELEADAASLLFPNGDQNSSNNKKNKRGVDARAAARARRREYARVGEEAVANLVKLALGGESQGWELYGRKQEVDIYRKTIPGASMPIVKGIGDVPFDKWTVLALVWDHQRKKSIDPQFDENISVDELDARTQINNQRFLPVWPTTARDFCMLGLWRELDDGTLVLAAQSVTHPRCPPDDAFVRADLKCGGFVIAPTGENASRIYYVAHTDLKGNLPGMVVASVSLKQPLVVANVRDVLSRDPVPDTSELKRIAAEAKGGGDGDAGKRRVNDDDDDEDDDEEEKARDDGKAAQAPAQQEDEEEEKDDDGVMKSAGKEEDLLLMNAERPTQEAAIPQSRASPYTRAGLAVCDRLLELDAQSDWQFLYEEADVRVFSTPSGDTSGLHVLRGVGVVNATPLQLLSVLRDPLRRRWYDEMCTEVKLIEDVADHVKVVRQVFTGRQLCSRTTREFVNVSCTKMCEGGVYVIGGQSVEHPAAPESSSIVRGHIHAGGFILRPYKGVCSVTVILHIDVRGMVPSWIVNMVQKKQPMIVDSVRALFSN